MKRAQALAAAALFLLGVLALQAGEECTTVVVAGKATKDGRPLLWKNRDVEDVHNEAVYIPGGAYPLVGVAPAGSTAAILMGVNSAGLAIENSVSYDLEGSSAEDNGVFMKLVLQSCATVAEFERLLQETNADGRRTKANFGVIDATGAAAIFETGNHTFAKYDANDPATAPSGFIVRTNFAFIGDGSGGGHERYCRALELIGNGIAAGEMSHEYLLRRVARDLRNDRVDPYPLPYEGSQEGHPAGYIRTYYSINRYFTRSCAVFHGVRSGEDPRLSTMWVVLGEPACGVAVPLWVHAGGAPPETDGALTAPLCDAALEKKFACYTDTSGRPEADQYLNTYALDDGTGGGILNFSLPIEDWVLARAEQALGSWRTNFPGPEAVLETEKDIVYQAYGLFLASTVPSVIPAPINLNGQRVLNRALLLQEDIDILTWSPRPGGPPVGGYRIYALENGKKTFLGQVTSSTTRFWRRNAPPDGRCPYAVTAVDSQGREGNPACIIIDGSSQRFGSRR